MPNCRVVRLSAVTRVGGVPVTPRSSGSTSCGPSKVGAISPSRIEFDSPRPVGLQTDILIADNTIVRQHYAFLVAVFIAAKIERLWFTGNDLIDGGQLRIWIDPGIESEDIRVDHNMLTPAPVASPVAAVLPG